MLLFTLGKGGGEGGTDKPVCGASESSRGGQLKLSCFQLACLQPTVAKIENKNLTAKLSTFSLCQAGRDLTRDNTKCFSQQYGFVVTRC